MRMWNVPTEMLCQKHLLGEHVELHMAIGAYKKQKSFKGFYEKKLIDPQSIYTRHDQLVLEMQKRGLNHKSPLEKITIKDPQIKLDIKNNILDLSTRCLKCAEKINQYEGEIK